VTTSAQFQNLLNAAPNTFDGYPSEEDYLDMGTADKRAGSPIQRGLKNRKEANV